MYGQVMVLAVAISKYDNSLTEQYTLFFIRI